MKPVTDPALLAQLNGQPLPAAAAAPSAPVGLKPVTDPALLAQLGGQPAAPTGHWTDNLRDPLAGMLKIGPVAAKGVVDLARLATGDRVGKDASAAIQGGMDAIDNTVGSERLRASKQAISNILSSDDFTVKDIPGMIADNPRGAVDAAISTLGSMVVPAGAAAGTVKALPALAKLFPALAKVAPGAAATGASVGAGALQNAAETYGDTEGADQGDRYAAAGVSGATSAVLGKLLGGAADGLVARRVAGEVSKNAAGQGAATVAKEVAKSMGKEAVQEFGEEGTNTAAKQWGKGEDLNPNAILKSGAYGGALGAVTGGGMHLATNGLERSNAERAAQAQAEADAKLDPTPVDVQATERAAMSARLEQMAARMEAQGKPEQAREYRVKAAELKAIEQDLGAVERLLKTAQEGDSETVTDSQGNPEPAQAGQAQAAMESAAETEGVSPAGPAAVEADGLTDFTPAERQAIARARMQADPVANPLADVQQQVRAGTEYTQADDVASTRDAVENAWLELNAATQQHADDSNAQAAKMPAVDGQAIAHVDGLVRQRRLQGMLQTLMDGDTHNTAQIMRGVERAMQRIGEQALSPQERAAVRRLADAYFGFKGAGVKAPLPAGAQANPAKPVDRHAQNASMEALVPERLQSSGQIQPTAQPGTEVAPVQQPTGREAFEQRKAERNAIQYQERRRAEAAQQRREYQEAERKRTAAGNALRARAREANPFKAFLGQHGVALDSRSEFAPGFREMRRAMVSGYGPIFRADGMPMDLLAERAHEAGFLRNASEDALYDLIDRAVRQNQRVDADYTADSAEQSYQELFDLQRELEQEQAERQRDELDMQTPEAQALLAEWEQRLQDVPDSLIEDALNVPEITDGSNVSTEDAMRALGFTEEEIYDATHPEEATQGHSRDSGRANEADTRAATGRAAERSQATGDQGEGLSSYTAAEARQRVAEQERAQAEQRQRDREYDRRAQADAMRDEFTLTGSDRAADANPNKVSMFSKPEHTSTGNTTEAVRDALAKRFGKTIDVLEARGLVQVWPDAATYNAENAGAAVDASSQGMYDGKTAHLFADAIEPGAELGVFLHEVGEHAGMQQMLGEQYDPLLERARELVRQGDPDALAAQARIPKDTAAAHQDSELVAYMVEHVANQKPLGMSAKARRWMSDALAAVRAWFHTTSMNKTLAKYGKGIELTPKDIAALAVQSVKAQAKATQTVGAGAQAAIKTSVKDQSPDAARARLLRKRAARSTADEAARLNEQADQLEAKAEADAAYQASQPAETGSTTERDTRHRAPGSHNGTSVDQYTGALDGDGFAFDSKAIAKLRGLRGKPDTMVTVYRSAPDGQQISAGDWVTLTPEYAQQHGEATMPEGFEVQSKQVRAAELFTDGNSVHELGYQPTRQFSKSARSTTGGNLGAAPGSVASAAAPWTVEEPGTRDAITRALQNSKVDLLRLRDTLQEKYGRLSDKADAYLSEELYHGKVAARVEALHDEYVKPLLAKIAVAGKNAGVSVDDVNAFLHARHAAERNAAMKAINPGMDNNDALSGMSDQQAATILARFRADGKLGALQAIATDVDTLLADTRTALVADGLEDADVVHAWEQAYKFYVPLQREADSQGGGAAKGMGFNVKGPEAKRAMGSNREVVNILANIVAQAETAAIRAEKAIVGRSLLQMAKDNPNADFWTVDVVPTKPRINKETGLVERNAADPIFKTRDNVVVVKEYGQEHFIVFNERSERAMNVAKAMKNLDAQHVGPVTRIVGQATRFMSMYLTARNPEFWLTNFARDIQASMLQLEGTDAKGLQAQVAKNLPKAMAGVRDLVRGDGKSAAAQAAREMHEAGGTTGYMQAYENSDERMGDLRREVERLQQSKADPRRLTRAALEFVDNYSEVVENGMRLAVYMAARDKGISVARAASIAKNITVNFNRKGNMSPAINSWYMFFNAAVQGSQVLVHTLKQMPKNRKVQGFVGGLALLGFLMDAYNRSAGGDDDETGRNRYDMIPEYEKNRNWIFMRDDGSYSKFPMPLGWSLIPNAGRLLSEATGRSDPRTASEYAWAMGSMFLDAFSPIGTSSSIAQLAAPSVLDPVLQVAENKNFAGGAVYKSADRGFGQRDQKPAYTRHFETTPDTWKQLSKVLNDLSGGDKVKPGMINIEPDIIRHIAYTLTGGPGRMVDKMVDASQAKARGQEVNVNRYPFASRFAGEVDDKMRERVYYDQAKRVEEAKAQVKYFTKEKRPELAREVVTELGGGDYEKGRLMLRDAKGTGAALKKINSRIKALRLQQSNGEDVQDKLNELRQKRTAVMNRNTKRTRPDDEDDES